MVTEQDALTAAKKTLRRAVLLRRDARAAERRAADDQARTKRVIAALEAQRPTRVAAYVSAGSEPGTLELIGWLAAHGVRVLLPVLSDADGHRRDEPAWAPYAGPDALRVGAFSLLEPTGEPTPEDRLPTADLIICTGLAANRGGDRLGRGGGWYDRALTDASPQTPVWVLLNDDEVLEVIPVQPWDRRVDVIVTPTRLITCASVVD